MTDSETNRQIAIRQIRALFDRAEDEGVLREVWNIVAGLRGPDDGPKSGLHTRNWRKSLVTTRLRRVVLTKRQASDLGVSHVLNWPLVRHADVRPLTDAQWDEVGEHSTSHFYNHARFAHGAPLI